MNWSGEERRRSPERRAEPWREMLDAYESRLTGWRWWCRQVLVSAFTALAIVAPTVWLVDRSNDASVDDARAAAIKDARGAIAVGQRKGCQRSNIREGQNRKIVGDSIVQLKSIYAAPRQIIWCERTYTSKNNGADVVFLPGPAQECYIRLVIQSRAFVENATTDPARVTEACRLLPRRP